jgi:hypothetical protein
MKTQGQDVYPQAKGTDLDRSFLHRLGRSSPVHPHVVSDFSLQSLSVPSSCVRHVVFMTASQTNVASTDIPITNSGWVK